MGYYYAGNRNSRADKSFTVRSTEMQNQRNEGYPGSAMMRERGWNPYRDEEEPVQYRDEEVNTRDWQREGSRMGNDGWQREGSRMGSDGWQREDNKMGNDGWQREDNKTGNDGWQREGSRMGNDGWQREGSKTGNENWQQAGSGWGSRCGNCHPLMMEMPQLNDAEQENMKQWNQPTDGQDCWRASGSRTGQPYQRYDYLSVLEDERMMENQLRRLQSMYPQAARDILPLVEDVCDRMEFEGSMMFDEHPDQNTVRRMSDEIYDQVSGMYSEEGEQQPEEIQSMEYQRGRRRPPHGNFLNDLVQVMLVQEMHRRRCRHHRCRPGRY